MNIGLLFLGLCFTVGSIFVLVLWVAHVRRGRASVEWNQVKGEIIESRLQPDSDGDSRVVIRFKYNIKGSEYIGEKMMFEPYSLKEPVPSSLVKKFHKGRILPVFVDPTSPKHAVLQPGISTKTVVTMTVFLLLFLVIGVVLLFFGWTQPSV